MSVTLHTGLAGLTHASSAWRAVFAAARSDNPFASWQWNDAWARRFVADPGTIHVFLVESGGSPVVIAPLLIANRRATSLADDWFADYAEFLVAGDAGRAALPELMSAILEKAPRLHLGPMRGPCAIANMLDGIATGSDLWLRTEICPNPAVPPQASFEAYLKSRAKRLRQELRTTVNHLERGGPWHFAEAEAGADFEGMFDALTGFHNQRQDIKAGHSIFDGGDRRQFLRDLPKDLDGGAAHAHMSALFWSGRIVSAAYSLRCGQTLFYWIPSFDPAIRSASLGKLHIRCLLERCFSRGLTFDFMGGDEPYKQQWATTAYPLCRFDRYASPLARQAAALKARMRDRLRTTMRASSGLTALRRSLSKLAGRGGA